MELTFKSDIFSLGCLFFYLETKGMHPFGELNEREFNISRGRYRLNEIKDEAMKNLIENMIQCEEGMRYNVKQCIEHPVFWNYLRKISFVQEFSDYIETFGITKESVFFNFFIFLDAD